MQLHDLSKYLITLAMVKGHNFALWTRSGYLKPETCPEFSIVKMGMLLQQVKHSPRIWL